MPKENLTKDQALRELSASIRRCEQTRDMLKQLPLFHEKRKELLEQTEMDIRLLVDIREKLVRK